MTNEQMTMRKAGSLLGRALLLRCPNCGARGIFAKWGQLKQRCPECGLWLERGEGDYYLGAYTVSLIFIETVFAIGFVAVLVLTWPDPPWDLIQWGGAVVLAASVVIAYPFSKTIFLAIDLTFRPVTPDDLSADGPIETHGPGGESLPAARRGRPTRATSLRGSRPRADE
jgi:uncharacterized protein (DUF983 family)